jgi:hypothetical protein
MIVKLLKDHTYKGVKFKEGQKIVMPRVDAISLCQEEIALANEDIPCGERQKKAAKEKKKKKKAAPKEELEMEVKIESKL